MLVVLHLETFKALVVVVLVVQVLLILVNG